MNYISNMLQVWYSDACHTLDRDNLIAASECGSGSYNTQLSDAADLRFSVLYWAQVQDQGNSDCLRSTLPNSAYNVII